jgi:quercetin dioxygenase-like cupin family protein
MGMRIESLTSAEPFTTKDGSTIRELHHTEAQSLAEATVAAGASTERHYHALTEEIYFVLEGEGELEIDGDVRQVVPGDAALIPPGARHTITATVELRFLCCCAPPYSDADTFFEPRG